MIKDPGRDDPRTYAIIGAAMEVHRVLGCGFLEPVYQKALAVEFTNRTIPCRRETSFPVFYKDVKLDVPYRPDFICFDNVVVELKALARISGIEESQVINYLKVTGYEIGLLLNFGAALTRVSSLRPQQVLTCLVLICGSVLIHRL
jgi:GxxExxY protein